MQIEVNGIWSDKDMENFTHLKDKNFSVNVDLDYVDDIDEFKSAFVDEVYRKFNVVISNYSVLDDMIQNWNNVYECFDDYEIGG